MSIHICAKPQLAVWNWCNNNKQLQENNFSVPPEGDNIREGFNILQSNDHEEYGSINTITKTEQVLCDNVTYTGLSKNC